MRRRRKSSRAKRRGVSSDPAANPFAPLAWPPPPVEALLVDPPPEPAPPVQAATSAPDRPAAAPVPPTAPEPPPTVAPPTVITVEAHAELLRLFGIVTNMCDHVIEYIESDRAERRVMLETLSTLGQTIADSAALLAPRLASAREVLEARVIEAPAEPRERVIGGSMPSGPEPVIDLRNSPAAADPAPVTAPAGRPVDDPRPPAPSASDGSAPMPVTEARTATTTTTTTTVMTTQIAVEVRGRFGDRWVDGFEICEVMETPEGHRYRLRRHRDGVVLPELFDATSIRHVETFDQLATTNGTHDQSMNDGNGFSGTPDTNVNDATGYAGPSVNGAPTRWSRS
jgi:hypothetical protein